MNKKIAGIIGLAFVVAVAIFLVTGKKENDVVTETEIEETTVEGVTSNEDENMGVDSESIVEDDIGTSESIVGSETTPDSIVESETTTPSETTTTPVESTEIQPVYEASEAPVPSTEETNKKLEEAGIDMRVEDTSQMTQEEIQAHNQAVYDDIWGDATTGYDDGDNTSVGITIQ